MLPTLTAALLAAAIAQSPLQYAGMRGSDLVGRGGSLDNLGLAIVQSLPGVDSDLTLAPPPLAVVTPPRIPASYIDRNPRVRGLTKSIRPASDRRGARLCAIFAPRRLSLVL
jgi:hypothetical protein